LALYLEIAIKYFLNKFFFNFQDATDHDVINCDHYLEQVFNCTKMRFMEVPQRLQQLLQQPDPLVIHHVIKWDGSSVGDNKNTACYDVSLFP